MSKRLDSPAPVRARCANEKTPSGSQGPERGWWTVSSQTSVPVMHTNNSNPANQRAANFNCATNQGGHYNSLVNQLWGANNKHS